MVTVEENTVRFCPLLITVALSATLLGALGQETPKKPPQPEEAKGTPPRSAPTDYQAQAKAGDVTVAADFLEHSVPREEGPLSTEDYVVVEAAVYGPAGQKLNLSIDQFSLRINGKKAPLTSEPYGLVVSNLRDPQWISPEEAERKKEKEEGGGGGGGLSVNGQGGGSNSTPLIVHIPVPMQRSMGEYVRKASFPEGEREIPVAGLLFFPYRGKAKNIHSVELLYSGPTGKATLALQP